jgi:nucleoid-associated protein Lsr2
MAQRTVVELIDDIDGAAAEETVGFGLDGVQYEIDLSQKNAAGLRDALAKYVGASRLVTRAGRARGTRSRVPSNSRTIREWAHANNVPVPDRGRIPATVVAQFDEANKR